MSCPSGSHGAAGAGINAGSGEVIDIEGMKAYITNQGQHAVIIAITDIFGFDAGRTRLYADKLASFGFTVIVPEVLGEHAFPANVPLDRSKFPAFLAGPGSWGAVRVYLEGKVLPYLQAQKYAQIGIIGFCWGAKIAINAAANPVIAASGLLHPSLLEASEIDHACGPVLFLPAGNDADMLPFLQQLSAKPFGALCGHRRYEEQVHGWTVRGDITVAAVARDVDESINDLQAFFAKAFAAAK